METRHLRGHDGQIAVSPGETIEAYVTENAETVTLAPALAPGPDMALQALREAHQNSVPVSGKVTGLNAGGLEVDLSGNRAFCPASQIALGYTADLSTFVGQSLTFKILEFGDGGRRIVVSRRPLLMEEKEANAAAVRERLQPGAEMDGTVVRMEAFGAFIDLGGLDGMVHVSEVAHDRVNHPAEALKIGDRVRVRVIEAAKDPRGRDRISLSIRAALSDPWNELPRELAPGVRMQGKVVRMADFGAFVRLAPGIEGLVHVSEIRNEKTNHPKDVLREGQDVEVRILQVDPMKKRISLSMRDESAPAAAGTSAPHAGMKIEGVVRAHKPYGVFIDLPSLGNRVSGLLPLEESGVPRGGDLAKQFPAGERMEVTIQQVDEKGRIRLSIPRADFAPSAAPTRGSQSAPSGPSRGVPNAMADALRRALEGRSL